MFIEVHGKNYVSRFAKTILNLKRYTIWNGGNSSISKKKNGTIFFSTNCARACTIKRKSSCRSPVAPYVGY